MTADPCHTALLRQAVDASGDVVCITDTDRVFTYVNQPFAKVYGYAAEDGVGRARPRIATSPGAYGWKPNGCRRRRWKPSGASLAAMVDLNDAVDRSWRMLGRLVGVNLFVRLSAGDSVWPVRIGPGPLDLVLMGGAVNARDAMPKGGALTFRTGIPAERRPPSVDSEVGQGATATVYLPRVDAPASAALGDVTPQGRDRPLADRPHAPQPNRPAAHRHRLAEAQWP